MSLENRLAALITAVGADIKAFGARLDVVETQRILHIDRVRGTGSDYIAVVPNAFVERQPGVQMNIVYTPPVDAWARVKVASGIIQCVTAGVTYLGVTCTPSDVDGYATVRSRVTKGADEFTALEPEGIWKLAAGVQYTFRGQWVSVTGAWQYHASPNYLGMSIEATAR